MKNGIRTNVENLFLKEMVEEDVSDIVKESTDIDGVMDIDDEEDLFDNYDGSLDDYTDDEDEEMNDILGI
jgi:hypothetical protein